MEKANGKTEKKFNGNRIARQIEKSLKAVFPGDKFFVSESRPVEVLYTDNNKCTQVEVNMFKTVFCELTKTRKEDVLISLVKKESATPAQAPVK